MSDFTIEQFKSEWLWARKLTVDLLDSLSEEELSFTLHETCGPLWKQFRHIGRVQENYLEAMQSQAVKFEAVGSYSAGLNKDALLKYFEELEQKFAAQLAQVDPSLTIDWFGESSTLLLHLSRLLSHETLHHGQLILYVRALGKAFPESWEAWGEH